MIDFKNGKVFKLSKSKGFVNANLINPLLIAGEEVIVEYQALRDFVVFTNKRIIAVNVQGITGSKKDFSSIPYSKIQVFSVETAGTFDLDAELEVTVSGMGTLKFEFSDSKEIIHIGKLIAEYTLR